MQINHICRNQRRLAQLLKERLFMRFLICVTDSDHKTGGSVSLIMCAALIANINDDTRIGSMEITDYIHMCYAFLYMGAGTTSLRSTHMHENVDKTFTRRATFSKDNVDLLNLCTYCLICASEAVWTLFHLMCAIVPTRPIICSSWKEYVYKGKLGKIQYVSISRARKKHVLHL